MLAMINLNSHILTRKLQRNLGIPYVTVPTFFQYVLFSDKASFHNNEQLNRCVIIGPHNPHWTQRVDNHRWSLNTWCRIVIGYLIGPFALPYIHSKAEDKANQSETISAYWLIEDMYTFENIGVSHTVGNVKYLACADCERGPVGWHDLSTKKSYVASCRVKYE
ncbi:Guanine nucleotide exchange factor MSS4 like protein [Atta colombica]|uniref:Guanine nucleotide exchange factor MSS4 like protein n=1 Tax=Atta colombica TaxID=520822 RepID=A0A195BP56_9HYME|nr:Guanine nucleotide exchange factor MSS4 like protein [Atta colombica]